MPQTSQGQELRHSQPDKIRVFVVEDEPAMLDALAGSLERGPEGDIVYAGGHSHNSPDLLDRIREVQANVVLVDLGLGRGFELSDLRRDPEGEISGLGVIRALRRHLGRDIKIVVYSRFIQLQPTVLDSRVGADAFISKAAPVPEIRRVIHSVMKGEPPDHVPPEFVGRITGLELFPASRQIILVGDRNTSSKLQLERPQFAFVHFLALERQTQDRAKVYAYWVVKAMAEESGEGYYEIQQPDLWEKLAAQHRSSTVYSKGRGGKTQLATSTIAHWCSLIKNELAKCHQETVTTPTLICVPGRGRPREGSMSVYTLHHDLTAQAIVIPA